LKQCQLIFIFGILFVITPKQFDLKQTIYKSNQMNKLSLLTIYLRKIVSVLVNSISLQVLGIKGMFLPLVSLEV